MSVKYHHVISLSLLSVSFSAGAVVVDDTAVPLVSAVTGLDAVVRKTAEIVSACCRTFTFTATVTLALPNALIAIKNKRKIVAPLVDLYVERGNQIADHCSVPLASIEFPRTTSAWHIHPVKYTNALVFEVTRYINTGTGQIFGTRNSGHCDSDVYGGGADSVINSVPTFQTGDRLRLQIGKLREAASAIVP